MSILNVRIDARLIHGQVANLWTSYLDVTRIMVIDEQASQSDMDKAGLRLACPAGVKLSVLPVEKAAANILDGKYDSQRVLIVVRNPQTALRLLEAGVMLEEINAGNMPKLPNTRAVQKTVHVTDEDVAVFKQIHEKGVTLTAQLVPNAEKVDLYSLL